MGLVGVLLMLTPTAALAHAGVVRTTPAEGERLAASPPTFSIEFSEPVGVDPNGIRLVDASGAKVVLAAARADGTVVVQDLPPLDEGWYQASWSVVSSDGHVVHGAIAFAVGDVTGPAPGAATANPVAIAVPIARGVADLGLVVAVGAVAAWVILRARTRRVRRLAIAASLIGAAGSLAVLALTFVDAGQAALAGPATVALASRVAILASLSVAVTVGAWRLGLGLAAAALATMAFGGHPSESPLTSVLLAIHLAAACIWLGAAPAVLLVLLDRRVDDSDALLVVRRFSKAATVVLFVVIGAGSVLALLLTDAQLDGLDPRYLGFLLAKVALVLVAAIMGAFTRRRLGTHLAGRSSLRKLFLVDSVLLVAVVACSAALTTGPPRESSADESIHVGHCPLVTDTGTASLSIVPSRVGDNTLYLDGAGTLTAASVELRLPGEPGAIEVALAPSGQGWKGTGAIPVAGVWDVTVAMQPDAFTVTRSTCQLRVQP
jgi:copper transport protein